MPRDKKAVPGHDTQKERRRRQTVPSLPLPGAAGCGGCGTCGRASVARRCPGLRDREPGRRQHRDTPCQRLPDVLSVACGRLPDADPTLFGLNVRPVLSSRKALGLAARSLHQGCRARCSHANNRAPRIRNSGPNTSNLHCASLHLRFQTFLASKRHFSIVRGVLGGGNDPFLAFFSHRILWCTAVQWVLPRRSIPKSGGRK